MFDRKGIPTPLPLVKDATAIAQRYTPSQASIIFHWYASAVILLNLLFLLFDGHNGDLNYWRDWATQLSTQGYKDFNGNYPPIYVHWLWITAKLFGAMQMPIELGIYLKFVTQLPVLVCHMLLTGIVYQVVKKYAITPAHFHFALALTALNPALLLNGPLWGQIDIIPTIPVLAAVLISCNERWRILALPLYCVGLLIKFQMIAFSPVMGVIFLRHWKTHVVGGLLSLLLIPIAFLPSIITGNAVQAFNLAYIHVLDQYGQTTIGAANIWILLTSNAAPDNVVLFGVSPDSFLAHIFTAKRFGMFLFVATVFGIFSHAVIKLIKGNFPKQTQNVLSQLILYAVLCSTAFFTFLPAMHERYILPAVVVSLVYFALKPNRLAWAVALTFLAFFNLVMTWSIKTTYVWPIIAWLMTGTMIAFLMDFFLPTPVKSKLWGGFYKILCIPQLSLWVLVITILVSMYQFSKLNVIQKPALSSNQHLLVDITPVHHQQGYGKLQINRSVDGNVLSVGHKRYAFGFGTHLNSVIDFELPETVTQFSFIAGVDNEVGKIQANFQVWGDGVELWSSGIHTGSERNLEPVELDITGVKLLSLRANTTGSLVDGHVDWVNPIITVKN